MLRIVRPHLSSFAPRSRMNTARHIATLAVLENGEVALDPQLVAPVLEKPSASQSQLRALFLNRPKALHALSQSMIVRLHQRLLALQAHPGLQCIVLSSTGPPGRAFCAGGDLRILSTGDIGSIATFFRAEYALNHAIATSPKHIVSLWDGIVMGGGAGLSVHGRFRVATENTVFAMPECSIGLHPDVGATHFLSRLPGALGTYLGLTGARLRGKEVRAAGLATHFVESQRLDALMQRLESVDVSTATAIDKVISEFEDEPGSGAFPNSEVINACFDKNAVEDVVAALGDADNNANDEGEAQFSRRARESIAKGSPSSLKATLESITRGRSMSIAECLDMEFRMSIRCAQKPDLNEGIRAAIIDRTIPPRWQPATLEKVTRNDVLAYFAPLERGTDVAELGLAISAQSTPPVGNIGANDANPDVLKQSRL